MTDQKVQEKMARVAELVKEGMSQEQAMETVLTETMAKPAKRTMIADRVEWISSLGNLAELDKAIRIAYAKKSKAKDKPETVAKYEKEIKAGQDRKNELLAELNQAEDKVTKAIELGMDPSKLLQDIIADMEDEVAGSIADTAGARDISKKTIKDIMANQATGIHPDIASRLGDLGQEFLDRYEERKTNGDQRVIALNKKFWTRDALETYTPSEAPKAIPAEPKVTDKKTGKKDKTSKKTDPDADNK